jgi:hypothetical protein
MTGATLPKMESAHAEPDAATRSAVLAIATHGSPTQISAACSHVRCQERRRGLSSPAFTERNEEQLDAHGRRQRLKTPVNKLSCAGWLPHDRDSVSGCLVLETSVGTWPAHNRSRGFPAVALPPAVGAWESDDSWMPSAGWIEFVLIVKLPAAEPDGRWPR